MIIDSGGTVMINGKKGKQREQQKNKQALYDGERQEKQAQRNNQPRVRAHLNLAESSLIAKDANVNTLVYTHFVPGVIDEAASLKIIRKQYKGKVIFGEDLMRIDMPEIKKH